MKRANNDAQSKTDQPSAEFVEKSPSAEGNFGQTTVTNTQRLEPASSDLSRVREAAKRDSKLQFNNLMHHVNIDLLRQSYFALKRNVAAGIDDVTWQEYGKDLDIFPTSMIVFRASNTRQNRVNGLGYLSPTANCAQSALPRSKIRSFKRRL